jgi:competence protein ComEC
MAQYYMIKNSTRTHEPITLSPNLLLIVLSFIAGIAWAINFSIDLKFLWLAIFLLGIILFAGHFFHNRWGKNPSVYLLIPFFFCIAALYVQPHLNVPADPEHIYNIISERQTVSLDGTLTEMPTVRQSSLGYKSSLLMQVKFLHLAPPDGEMLNNRTIKAKGLVQLHLKGILPGDIKPGDRFIAKSLVSRVTTYSTPGAFNYKAFLANRSIWVNGWIESPVNIVELHENLSSIPVSNYYKFRYLPERIRTNISSFLDKNLDQPARGLYKAILIGYRNDISPSVLENFTRSGCVHILAISGMHMGLLGLFVIGILTWLLKRSILLILYIPIIKVAAGLALLPLLIYALIAGFNTPVVRALIMTIVFVLALLFDRPGSLPTHIFLAALAILIWNPTSLSTASFQLSFSAVIAIGIIYPRLYQFLFHDQECVSSSQVPQISHSSKNFNIKRSLSETPVTVKKWLFTGLTLTTAAMLGTLPIVIFHFNRFSLVSPLTNLIVEPLICLWSLVLGIIACLFIPFAPWFAQTLFQHGSWGLLGAERICAFFGSLQLSSIWVSTPTFIQIVFYYLFLACLILHLYKHKHLQDHWIKLSSIFLVCLLLSAGYPTLLKQFSSSTTVSFLDVGQGTSTLLQLPHNKNILIDGGGAASDRFNIGERIIAPFLWKNKINRLDGLVITHPHADHYNGLPFVIQRFQPKVIWVNGDQEIDHDYLQLLKLADHLDVEIITPSSEMLLFQSADARLKNISIPKKVTFKTSLPISNKGYNVKSNPNNRSLVLRLDTNKLSYLFPGDINSFMEKELITKKKRLKADILLAAHHGSSSSNSSDFMNAVDPSYLVISTGRQNPFLFLNQSLTENSSGVDIQVYTTAKDGTVTFTDNGEEISVSRYQIN